MARVLWPEAEVVAVDARVITHLVEDGAGEVETQNLASVTRVVADVRALPEDVGEFEVILASHVLEHLTRAEVVPALIDWAEHLLPAGELHVLVPDLVWAAERVVSHDASPKHCHRA